MGIIGNGMMVSLLDEAIIRDIKKGSLKEFPDNLLRVVTEDGKAFGIVVELYMEPEDYEKKESFVVCGIKKSSTEHIKSGFKNSKNMPVYSFKIKKN